MPGPRSNYSRLPKDIRRRILFLRHDGAEYAEIRADEQIAIACKERGLVLNNGTFSSIAFKRDLDEFAAQSAPSEAARRADDILSAVLETNGSLADISDVIRYELAKLVRGCIAAADDPKDVERLVRSAAALTGAAKDDVISGLRKKLDDAKHKTAELERSLDQAQAAAAAREKELLARIADLEGGAKAAPGMSAETLAEVEEKIKML